jgi:putative acetyltransferase
MLRIRPEAPADRKSVFAVEAGAFARRNEAELVDAMRPSADPMLSLVATLAEEVVGHIFFSPVAIESRRVATPAAALGPVAVEPAHQGKGVGSSLVRAGLAGCSEHGWRAVFLVGNPAYYSRFGFVLAAPLGLHYGSGDPLFDSVFQVVELDAGALAECKGRVEFHPAFAEAETG